MIAYVDSSVLLRVALGQPNALTEWKQIERGVSSALISTESLRTLDRLRIRAGLSDPEVAASRETILALIDSLELVDIDARVLDRASQPMPTELGTLDAIHLASALLWMEETGLHPVVATHDIALGLAAQAHGLKVKGIAMTPIEHPATCPAASSAATTRPQVSAMPAIKLPDPLHNVRGRR